MTSAGHYDPALSVQPDSAVLAVRICFGAIPALFCVIACIIMLFYDLDKIYPQIQKELAERRGQVDVK